MKWNCGCKDVPWLQKRLEVRKSCPGLKQEARAQHSAVVRLLHFADNYASTLTAAYPLWNHVAQRAQCSA